MIYIRSHINLKSNSYGKKKNVRRFTEMKKERYEFIYTTFNYETITIESIILTILLKIKTSYLLDSVYIHISLIQSLNSYKSFSK